jgi:formamidopyrimidine-DNA glycosylase
LRGQKITAVHVREPRLRYPVDVSKLAQGVHGRFVEKIYRRAKYLIFQFNGSYRMIVHLGMSGRLLILPADVPLHKHDHVQFSMDNGMDLRFRDHRRFGMVDVLEEDQMENYKYFRHLGVEPLSAHFRAKEFFQKTRGLKKPIKNYLMDAQKIVGIGNIYANESLFLAGIHPRRPVGKISLKSWQKLALAVRKVLRQAIQKGGTSFSDFVHSDGEAGYFQICLRVYQRESQPCKKCKKSIRKIILANRSTYFCSNCQK